MPIKDKDQNQKAQAKIQLLHREAEAYQIPVTVKPVNGILDERVGELVCRRVKTLTVDTSATTSTVMTGDLLLENGYNTTTDGAGPTTAGVVTGSTITLGAAAGSGQGTYKDCEATPTYSTLAGAAADQYGNVRLSGDGCISMVPVVTTTVSGKTMTGGVLQINNDCSPCCQCEDFVILGTATNRVWLQLQTTGVLINQAVADYTTGVTRWNSLLDRLTAATVAIQATAYGHQYIDVALQVCNTTDTCFTNFQLKVATSVVAGSGAIGTAGVSWTLSPDSTFISNLCGTLQPVTPSASTGPWLVDISGCPNKSPCLFYVTWATIQPRTSGTARFRLAFTGIDATHMAAVTFQLNWGAGGKTASYYLVQPS